MKGRHHIILETAHLKYEFDVKRNITVIMGDSATGKTTLVDLLAEYSLKKGNRGIRLESDVPCEVYAGRYYVIITRRPLKNLPYSITEIYGILTSGKYHFPDQV